MSRLKCPYCGNRAKLVTGEDIYFHMPNLWDKYFFSCQPCAAWVGCHTGTKIPLGTLANSSLRQARQLAHAEYDPLWKIHGIGRHRLYKMLAKYLGIERKKCHIAMFDKETCLKVIEFSKQQYSIKEGPENEKQFIGS